MTQATFNLILKLQETLSSILFGEGGEPFTSHLKHLTMGNRLVTKSTLSLLFFQHVV